MNTSKPPLNPKRSINGTSAKGVIKGGANYTAPRHLGIIKKEMDNVDQEVAQRIADYQKREYLRENPIPLYD